MKAGKNTRVSYLYRDASNSKRGEEVVLAGSLTYEQVAPYLADGVLFIASDVGLSDPQATIEEDGFAFPADGDHVFCELEEDGLEPTDDPPTAAVTAAEVLARFERVNGKWDVAAAEERLGLGCEPVRPARTKVVRVRCEAWPGWEPCVVVPAEASQEQLRKLARRVAVAWHPPGPENAGLICGPADRRPALSVEEIGFLDLHFWLGTKGKWHLMQETAPDAAPEPAGGDTAP